MTATPFNCDVFISEIPATGQELDSKGRTVNKNMLVSDLASHIKLMKSVDTVTGFSSTTTYQIRFDGHPVYTITEETYEALKTIYANPPGSDDITKVQDVKLGEYLDAIRANSNTIKTQTSIVRSDLDKTFQDEYTSTIELYYYLNIVSCTAQVATGKFKEDTEYYKRKGSGTTEDPYIYTRDGDVGPGGIIPADTYYLLSNVVGNYVPFVPADGDEFDDVKDKHGTIYVDGKNSSNVITTKVGNVVMTKAT